MFNVISISIQYFKRPIGHSLYQEGRGLLRLIEGIYYNWTLFVRHLFTG